MKRYFLTLLKIITFLFVMFNLAVAGFASIFLIMEDNLLDKSLGWFSIAFSLLIIPIFPKLLIWCMSPLDIKK